MYQETISPNVKLFISEENTWNWPQHADDAALDNPRFITYIGGNNYSKLDKILADLPYPVRAFRRDAKTYRRVFTYELKIWGLRMSDAVLIAQAIANKKQPDFGVAA